MKAAWYEKQGPAREVLVVGEMPDPEPGPREVRIRIAASGINPGDVKKRRDEFGYGMPYPRVVPHSDGAGTVDRLGESVSEDWLHQRVWCFGARSYRPFGTAAEYTVVPVEQVVMLPAGVTSEQGACLGIPGITGHRAVRIADPVAARTVLVRGAAGAVGLCAVQIAYRDNARVIGAIRNLDDEASVWRGGAAEVVVDDDRLVDRVLELAPDGVDHVVEPDFAANLREDVAMLAAGGSVAAYASGSTEPPIPFWGLAFRNARLFFLGSDDFKLFEKITAARDVNAALAAGWPGFEIAAEFPLADIAEAHEMVGKSGRRGRVVLKLD